MTFDPPQTIFFQIHIKFGKNFIQVLVAVVIK